MRHLTIVVLIMAFFWDGYPRLHDAVSLEEGPLLFTESETEIGCSQSLVRVRLLLSAVLNGSRMKVWSATLAHMSSVCSHHGNREHGLSDISRGSEFLIHRPCPEGTTYYYAVPTWHTNGSREPCERQTAADAPLGKVAWD